MMALGLGLGLPLTLTTGWGVIFDFQVIALDRVIYPQTQFIDTRTA